MFCHNFEIKKYEDLLGSKVFCTGSFLSNNFAINQSKKVRYCFYFYIREINKNNPIKMVKLLGTIT